MLDLEKRTPAFILSSLLSSYPDENFVTYVRHLLDESELASYCESSFPEKWESLKNHLGLLLTDEVELNNLRADFIDIFERGRQSNPLYETEFGRSRALVKGNELTDIAGFYKAFGFLVATEETHKDMVDHIAIELEFYALLLMKEESLRQDQNQEGIEIVVDAQGKFLKDHLGRFVTPLMQRPGVASHPFYRDSFDFVNTLIKHECLLLGVVPDLAEWIDSPPESELPGCGALSCFSGAVPPPSPVTSQ